MKMLAEIGAALSALKMSSDVIGAVVKTDKALAVAELKNHLANAVVTTADARVALIGVQEIIDAKDSEIARLNEALSNKEKVGKEGDAYYSINDQGQLEGNAFCMRCFQVDHKLFNLTYPSFTNEPTACPVCKAKYSYGHTRRIKPEQKPQAAP